MALRTMQGRFLHPHFVDENAKRGKDTFLKEGTTQFKATIFYPWFPEMAC